MDHTSLCNPARPCALLGAVQAIAGVRDSVCLIHGTVGCGFFCRNHVIRKAGYFSRHSASFTPMVFCTEMGENEIILGGESLLVQAMQELFDKYHPRVLFVLTTCASEIIGDNVDGLVQAFEKDHCFTRVIHCPGFTGDWNLGTRLAAEAIASLICELSSPCLNYDLVVCDSAYLSQHSLQETIALFHEKGVSAVLRNGGNVTLEDLQQLFFSKYNFVSDEGFLSVLARIAEKKKGGRCISDPLSFYSDISVRQFVDGVCRVMTGEADTVFAENRPSEQLLTYMDDLRGCKAAILASPQTAQHVKSLLDRCGVECFMPEIDSDDKAEIRQVQFVPLQILQQIRDHNCRFIFSSFPEFAVYFKNAKTDYLLDRYLLEEGLIAFAKRLVSDLKKNEKQVFYYVDFA